jgi:antitoxin MazE
MQTRVQRWGNSLALRIPKSFAEETQIGENSLVEVSLEDGRLIVAPARPAKPTLGELLAQVTDENLHSEVDTGAPVGAEVW